VAKKAKSEAAKIEPLEKIARLLAMHVSKGMDPESAAVRLLAVGFDAPLIGMMLGKNPNFANAAKSRLLKATTKDKD
jgi:hypothetical protein